MKMAKTFTAVYTHGNLIKNKRVTNLSNLKYDVYINDG